MEVGCVKCMLVEDDPLVNQLGLQLQPQFLIAEIHQDEIQGLPSGARLLASSRWCPVEAYAIDNHILAFQGHPEFSNEFLRHFISACRERKTYTVEECDRWAASVEQLPLDTPRWHAACRRFLKAAAEGPGEEGL
mmetsp:Transcript_23223/g.64476  ORF Transcript_23223/g.64476 Transcript_23223/m.64476 type:complete len:135 (-) Transcript_23223:150-554(-)